MFRNAFFTPSQRRLLSRVLACFGLMLTLGVGMSAHAATVAMTLTGQEIVSVDEIASPDPAGTAADIAAMYPGSRWDLYADGTFLFTPHGLGTTIRTDIYPVPGQYQPGDGGTLLLHGLRYANYGISGFAAAQIDATLIPQGDGAVLKIVETIGGEAYSVATGNSISSKDFAILTISVTGWTPGADAQDALAPKRLLVP